MGNTGGDQSELDRALEFYEAEDYASAEPILRREAERGNAVAQFKLGKVLDRTGREEEAIVFLRKAVEAGNAYAMIDLGSLVGFDEGVDLYERAIAAGVPSGVACLGHHLWNNGQKERARDLLEDAAKKGDSYAAGRLAARLFQEGSDETRYWASQAADLGSLLGFYVLVTFTLSDDEALEENLDVILRALALPPSMMDERYLRGQLRVYAGLNLAKLGRLDEAAEHLAHAPPNQSRDELLALVRQVQIAHAAEADDWQRAHTLLQAKTREAGRDWDDPEVLQERLDMADEMARFYAYGFALDMLADLRSDARRSLGQGADLLSAIEDREVFFRAIKEGRTDHLEEERDYGIMREAEDFDALAERVQHTGVIRDWFERDIEFRLGQLLRQGFMVDAFVGARQLAYAGLYGGMHLFGRMWIEIGHLEDGLRWLERAAGDGYPAALASHGWELLRTGQHERAVAFFDETWARCQEFGEERDKAWELEQLNIRSNDALHRLALGADPAVVRAIWQECSAAGHDEATVYAAVLAARAGDAEKARSLLGEMADYKRDGFVELFQGEIARSTGWFLQWSRSALDLLTQDA